MSMNAFFHCSLRGLELMKRHNEHELIQSSNHKQVSVGFVYMALCMFGTLVLTFSWLYYLCQVWVFFLKLLSLDLFRLSMRSARFVELRLSCNSKV